MLTAHLLAGHSVVPSQLCAPPSCHQPFRGSHHLQGGGQSPRLGSGAPSALPALACVVFGGCLGRLPPSGGVSQEQGQYLCACWWLSHRLAYTVCQHLKLPNIHCVHNTISSLFFFCSNGWCAFYDFREVFLCSRKCKFCACSPFPLHPLTSARCFRAGSSALKPA